MKKILFVFLLIILNINIILSASDMDKIIVKQGQKNLSILKKANPVYVYFTFYNTKMRDITLDEYIKKKKYVKDPKELKTELIEKFKKNFTKWSKNSGSKWGMKVINSLSEAKRGYILHINYDKLHYNRASSIATGYATVRMYPAGRAKNIIFTGTMKAEHNAWGSFTKSDSPEGQFGNVGIVFAVVVVDFFKEHGR